MQQSVSKEQLKQRRRQLRQQRRVRAFKSLWRFGCMSVILAGVGWVAQHPDWQISKAEQIRIQGNNYLTDGAIRSMLGITYPQMMMALAPEQLTAKISKQGSIASVKIDRNLLPPHLLIQVQDLPPVARVIANEQTLSQTFVDEQGRQLPISSYRSIVQASPPTLRLQLPERGMCPDWQELYRAIRTSPVAIGIIDCRDPQNLTLQTEVGTVRLGGLGGESRFTSQIHQLDRLRNWRQFTPEADAVRYLDLENPDAPFLRLKQSGKIAPKLS